ncbi:MAG: PilZ domain-containing protein [Candidatus Aenigmarchaeota archaeon]|nr:PilZ domain-containing protein [Candidatus Aenigmarchaeota archaeon]
MLEVNLRKSGAVAVVDLSGTIDIDASSFIEKVGWCLNNGYKEILCNLENVEMVDYAGLTVLSIAYKNVLNHKGRLKLTNVSAHIKKTFSLVCLDKVFEMFDDDEFALRSFEEDRIICEIKKKQLRRRFKRLPLDIDIHFRSKAHEKNFNSGKILNLSAVGMLVFAERTYPLGEILELELSLYPHPGRMEVNGKVVWLVQKDIQPQIYPAMGIEFYRLDSDTQQHIVNFVDRNLPLNSASEC